MKALKQTVVLLLAVTTMFSSCKKDEEQNDAANNANVSALVGTWKGISANYKEYRNNVLVEDTSVYTNATFTVSAEFTTDGKWKEIITTNGTSETSNYTYKTDGNKLTQTSEDGYDSDYIYAINGTRLTLTMDNSETYQDTVWRYLNVLIYEKQ